MKRRNGQVIIESIIGITVALVGLLGALTLLTSSLGINKDLSQEFVATYLAVEGIEVVKSIIDMNYSRGLAWNTGISKGSYTVQYNSSSLNFLSNDPSFRSSTPLSFDPIEGIYSYAQGGNLTQFRRTIQIREDPSGLGTGVELGVVAVVEWVGRGGEAKEVVVEDHFFDWR